VTEMFHTIVAAYNVSPEAQRALGSAILLSKSLGAQLHTVTALVDLPSYTAFASVADPALPHQLDEARLNSYSALETRAREHAASHGITIETHLVEGKPVEAIVEFLRRQKADLLVIGLHQREFYIARLWSTVYELAQDAPCSVLGVH
jgi:nucleotide-binding universal stress UspA family protein